MTVAAKFVDALQRRDRKGAVIAAWSLIEENASLRAQWQSVARFAAVSREWTLAIASIERFLRDDPTDPRRIMAHAEILAEAGRLKEAVPLVERLAAGTPQDASYQHFLGTAYVQLGQADAGLLHLLRAVDLQPGSGLSWLALSNAHGFTTNDHIFRKMQSAEPHFARSPASARAPYLFALGKAWDDLGEADRAFAAFDEGARLTSAERPYAAEQDKAAAERLVGNVAPAWMASAAVDASAPSKPIFVTGIPRSGTTLVEQMLTSHSQVSNGGELNLMAAAAAPLGALDLDSLRRTYDAAGSPAPWAAVRELYLHLVTERFGSDGRIVDKTLNASRFAALVRLAFPEAPVIWLRRDPLDTAWSCFRTYFVTGAPWSFSLADIGRYMAVEDFLFERWQAVFGDQMMVLPYRDLVEDSETWIPAMLGHASLPSEAGVFAFNATERAVTTSSVAQVREPLYQRGLGSSAPYRAYLQPFMQAYEAARAQLGLRSAQS